MQQYQLTLTATKRPETLERILRVTRHRGFELVSLQAHQQEKVIELQMTVQSQRAIELLVHQLIKLPDVITLN